MLTVWLGLIYPLLHFAAYVVFFRRHALFRTEKGIFFLHFVSACLLPLAVFGLSINSGFWFAALAAVTVAAAHGVYSISFLELWSLSEGSYSFAILRAIEARSPADPEHVIAELGAVGDMKKDQRLQSLHRLRLITQDRQKISLTPRGRRIAAILRGLRILANLSETG